MSAVLVLIRAAAVEDRLRHDLSRRRQHTMVMGDLVLTEDEVNPIISALQAGGFEQTALHNHVLRESPRVMYLHFDGHGDAAALARTLRVALDRTNRAK